MNKNTSARIRMFRLNELGDCFLVTFTAGASQSNLLIDCGSFRNDEKAIKRITEIVTKGIKPALGKRPIDVVIGTHQHNDHLSGFVHCKDEFSKIGVGQVWLSWLDNPRDKKAQEIGKEYNNLTKHLSATRNLLHSNKASFNSSSPNAARAIEVLDDILGFYGASQAGVPPKVPADAVEILKTIGKEKPKYLKPGQSIEMPGLPSGSVKIHVLGPPRIAGASKKDDPLFRKDPRNGESYDALASASLHALRVFAASKHLTDPHAPKSRDEEHYPFNQKYKRKKATVNSPLDRIVKSYNVRSKAWRKIDDDWMQQVESLALYLDTFTNNSSLVVAIELVESGKVLLFAADAQTGNWASWQGVNWEDKTVTTDDLLARTVFYKVGHHASHNATLVEEFEKMDHPDLVALIPVHKQDPNIKKRNGWKMPAKNLFKHLVKSTQNRVLQMDDDNPASCDPEKNPAKASWKKVGITPQIGPLSIEIEIKG